MQISLTKKAGKCKQQRATEEETSEKQDKSQDVKSITWEKEAVEKSETQSQRITSKLNPN